MGKKQQHPEEVTSEQAYNLTGHLSAALAFLTVLFLNYGVGKNFCRNNFVGGCIAMGLFITLFPTPSMTRFAVVWFAAVCLQSAYAHFNHWFGTREHTYFVGYPIISLIIPWPNLCRRLLNPVLTFFIGSMMDDRALMTLFKFSAIGQFVFYTMIYLVEAANDDAKSDAMRR